QRYARAYGTRAERLIGGAASLDGLGAQIAPGIYEAELRYLRDTEFATCAQDVLWRRSKLGLHVASGTLDAVAAALEAWFAASRQPVSSVSPVSITH
uniref:glycerol-3-phosphate dehydrogenase C-terminal domain-containing protein n=1 Tax=Paraburkholderia sp. TaxID=1926495 RepID=UPI00286F7C43